MKSSYEKSVKELAQVHIDELLCKDIEIALLRKKIDLLERKIKLLEGSKNE